MRAPRCVELQKDRAFAQFPRERASAEAFDEVGIIGVEIDAIVSHPSGSPRPPPRPLVLPPRLKALLTVRVKNFALVGIPDLLVRLYLCDHHGRSVLSP